MAVLASRTDPDVLAEIRRRFVAGEPPKAIAIDVDVSDATVVALCADLPQSSPKREARRLAILACLAAGLDVRATAEKVPCTIAQVVRIINASQRARVTST